MTARAWFAANLMALISTVSAAPLQTAPVAPMAANDARSFDGVIEAVRQTVVAAQVAGALVALEVKAGDRVKAGQLLARIDARSAEQAAAASDAQVQAARAALQVASRDFERQQKLAQQRFISQAALDRAQADYQSTQAQLNAQIAQASASHTQSGLYLVRAPYSGVVSEVPVALGDMAMPGKPLLTLYEPGALRITVPIPQTLAARTTSTSGARIEWPDASGAVRWITPARTQTLPTLDPATHTVQMRLDLPPGTEGLAPGGFARVWFTLGGASGAGERLAVPRSALLRRAELVAVYVVDASGRPSLRQVRAGRGTDQQVEILSGLSSGERVALDPQAAAAFR